MDAAHYITTLEQTVPVSNKPETAAYAIVDLAVGHDFLQRLYEAMNPGPIEWWSLFEGSEWQGSWTNGPILVELSNSTAFIEQLASEMEGQSLGVLIESSASATDLRERCQHWLLGSDASGKRLLRFYEPRMLGPLLCVLGDGQRQQLVPPNEQWSWHDGAHWRSVAPTPDAAMDAGEARVTVSDDQLRKITPYRMAAESRNLADHYRERLAEYGDPATWVMARLLDAQQAGITQVSDQERWLRLVLRHGDAFPVADRFRGILDQTQRSASERLTALESLRKNDDAPTV
ncbi:MAG: DUF4123 domain-containing protein [Marinobacter sp.]|uniref:DUF4123 domain-containing protein n=1 Tax=Marinobacter sp. TaxID=50741 RepID=UPI00299D4E8D|nr:DUF4123 domain-containing protein [Marinobacter sp.]MDX1636197.1 DUF4123 domain-containing protein [Marinobacter sp.]